MTIDDPHPLVVVDLDSSESVNGHFDSDLFFTDPVAAAKKATTTKTIDAEQIKNNGETDDHEKLNTTNLNKTVTVNLDYEVDDDDDDDDKDDDVVDNEAVNGRIKMEKSSQNDEGFTADGATTVINGLGIWHSWTRNFSTPLLALLDLLDNAFDAASLTHSGRIYISPDTYNENKNEETKLCRPNGSIAMRTTGLTIWNNSIAPIKPLQKVLEVYTSQKGAHSDSIGENGVGLKQGCATLSNLSFCVVKSYGNRYSMGIIAYQLQTKLGCSLPAFSFDSTNIEDLRKEMLFKFTNEHRTVAECIINYGAMDGGLKGRIDTVDPLSKRDYLRMGINRLIEKFQYMNQQGWEKYEHVFGLVVDHVKHGEKKSGLNAATIPAKEASMDQQIRVNKLLETLYEDLPKRYLHIPTSLLDVRVGGQRINFNYWQPRLVEMAQFDIRVHTSAHIIDIINAKKEKLAKIINEVDFPDEVADDDVPVVDDEYNDPGDSYVLRIYTGFDALRVCDERQSKTAAMYLYSRQSGRLIKANLDCRGELGLTSGGTDFCQGLTLIVDDFNANFPLNPTKQDVAFGEQANGETHKRNLYINLNAALRFYYMFYKDRVCSKQKAILSESLRSIEPQVRQAIQQSSTSFSSLSECEFTTFGNFTTNCLNTNNQSIKLLSLAKVEYFLGKDSILKLPPIPKQQLEMLEQQLPRRKSKKKQHQKSTLELLPANNEDGTDESAKYKARRRHGCNEVQYYDNEDDDDEVAVVISEPPSSNPRKRPRKSVTSNDNNGSPKDAVRAPDRVSSSNRYDNNDDTDILFMTKRISELENDNRQLKKMMKQSKKATESANEEKANLISDLKAERTRHKNEVIQYKQQIKLLKEKLQQLSSKKATFSLSDEFSSPDASKIAKRLKNFKSSNEVLRAENEDLKEQIKGLEATIHRKEKTILAQRKLIDQRNKEDDEEDDVEEIDADFVVPTPPEDDDDYDIDSV